MILCLSFVLSVHHVYFANFQTTKTFDYEHSEMLLYQNDIMIDGGMHKEALDHLKEFESQITDKVTVLETKGKDLFWGAIGIVIL